MFQPYPVKLRLGWGKYCSIACYRAVQHQRPALVEMECEQCGARVRRTRAAIDRHRRHFCSKTCQTLGTRGAAASMYRGGRDRTRGAGWGKRAEAIRRRDGHRCQRCTRSQEENGQKLSVDHIIPWRLFEDKAEANRPENLISLCKFCHSWKTSRAEQKYLRGDVLDFRQYERAIRL